VLQQVHTFTVTFNTLSLRLLINELCARYTCIV